MNLQLRQGSLKQKRYAVQHIQSDSSDQNEYDLQVSKQTNWHTSQLLINKAKGSINEENSNKKKRMLVKQQHKNTVKEIDLLELRNNEYESLPQECLQVNQLNKQQSYQDLYCAILCCFNMHSSIRTIFVSGDSSSAKKTLVINILRKIKQKISFKNYFVSFKQTISNDLANKAKGLCQFIKNTFQVSGLQERNDRVKRIFVVDGYRSLIAALKTCSLMQHFKQTVNANKSALFIMVDSNLSKREVASFTQYYLRFDVVKNRRQYFMDSMLAMVNNYNYSNLDWQLMRPLANFFSTKMQNNNTLQLTIIRKFISFLQRQGSNMQRSQQKVKVNRHLLQKFMGCITDQRITIDLKRLTIHEKALLTACYLILKKQPSILVPITQAHKTYLWICDSIGMKGKEIKEFTLNLVYQLQVYKVLKLQRVKEEPKRKQILITHDLDWIKSYLSDEFVLQRFYRQD